MISRQDLETVLNTAGIPRVDTMKICHAYDKMIGEQTPPQFQGKTVDVKVPVVVTPEGKWHGYDYMNLEPGCVRFWLTATLPVPAEVVVVAKAEGE